MLKRNQQEAVTAAAKASASINHNVDKMMNERLVVFGNILFDMRADKIGGDEW